MVFATQCLKQQKQNQMRIVLNGGLQHGVTIKDVILALIAKIGTAGARGYAIEYAGSLVENLSMEARMTLCNMTVEAGARIGLIAPDETTFAYLKGRPLSPNNGDWIKACESWRALATDPEAIFDKEVTLNVTELEPHVSWGTTPAQSMAITGAVPQIETVTPDSKGFKKAITYMGLRPGEARAGLRIDRVFIGSCTNSRIEDLRSAAAIVANRKVAAHVNAIVVPGSTAVQAEAEAEGLDQVFKTAGLEWRNAGCSMCVAMNNDRLIPGERCASTSNRNFEGRQGPDGRTHLMSPSMAAAAAIAGKITDVRDSLRPSHA